VLHCGFPSQIARSKNQIAGIAVAPVARGVLMTDRRRAPRYQICRTTQAQFGLLQDVAIQSVAGDDVIVLASMFPANCDRLVMQLVRANGEIASLGAAVRRTAPVLSSGVMQYLLELRVEGLADTLRHDLSQTLV